jgi:hypothetical protein
MRSNFYEHSVILRFLTKNRRKKPRKNAYEIEMNKHMIKSGGIKEETNLRPPWPAANKPEPKHQKIAAARLPGEDLERKRRIERKRRTRLH